MANNFQNDIEKIVEAIEQLYNISIKKKQTMPEPSLDYENQIILYVGETNNTYVKDTFYRCEKNGSNYVWIVSNFNGNISLTKADVGLGNVDNTADLNKPVSNPALEVLCPHTETTDLVITDAISHNVIDYTIYGNTVNNEGVGNLVSEGTHSGEYKIPIIIKTKNLFPNADWLSGIHQNGFLVNRNFNYIKSYSRDKITFKTIPAWGAVSTPIFDKGEVETIIATFNQSQKDENNYERFYILLQGYDDNNQRVGNSLFSQIAVQNSKMVFNMQQHLTKSFYINSSKFSFCICVRKDAISNLEISDFAMYADNYSKYEPYNKEIIDIYSANPIYSGESISLLDTGEPLPFSEYTNIITFDTSVQPSSVKIKYYQDINKVIANLQALILSYHS